MTDTHYAMLRLWAKKAVSGESKWLPLVTHLEDAAALARIIWRRWLSYGVRQAIAKGCACSEEEAEKLFIFIMASHDSGKALPVFQAKPCAFVESDLDERLFEELMNAGLMLKPYREFHHPQTSRHALAGQLVLEEMGCCRNIAVIVGAHHGAPASFEAYLNGMEQRNVENFSVDKPSRDAWKKVRAELLSFALALAGYSSFGEMPVPDAEAEVLLTGLAIMTDWIASNEDYFPYIDINDPVTTGNGKARALAAVPKLNFIKTAWSPNTVVFTDALFVRRFDFEPRPLQSNVIKAASAIKNPGILILEAVTGIGKTETALALAELFATKTGRSGVFFALPTQATSDGMFPRLLSWINRLEDGIHSINLVHGKAQLNDDLRKLAYFGAARDIAVDESSDAAIFSWFSGRKKALLADFAVGTVDQLLQLASKQKHVMLRHLALGSKTVIIDECHAYDAYMNVYLKRALMWLGRYRVPVILLSATLPSFKREELVNAYLGKDRTEKGESSTRIEAYPLITYTDGDKIFHNPIDANMPGMTIAVEPIDEDSLISLLDELITSGGCAGVIVNTVRRAQELAKCLREHFADDIVRLLHSRLILPERIARERELRRELGAPGTGDRPAKRIVIGTQVVEQSLDLDFDVMFTDLCPIDLLLQRAGRLHRHKRPRPDGLGEAKLYVMGILENGFDSGSQAVYGAYLLMRTRAFLPHEIRLPDDVSSLVKRVYGDEERPLQCKTDEYQKAMVEWETETKKREEKAKAFRIGMPPNDPDDNIMGWLDTPVGDAEGEAAVRDSSDSLEVIAVRRDEKEGICLISSGKKLSTCGLSDEDAILVARESLRLPPVLCRRFNIQNTISTLDERMKSELNEWRASPWLNGSLIMILDNKNETCIGGYRLKYDAFFGLTCEKEDGMDG